MSPQIEEKERIEQHVRPTNGKARIGSHRGRLILIVALVAVGAILSSGIWSRVKARTTLKTETAQVALTAVSVVSPKQTALAQEIILPGNVQPFITSPI